VPILVPTLLLVKEQVAPHRGGTTELEKILEDGLLRIVAERQTWEKGSFLDNEPFRIHISYIFVTVKIEL
jgi:hypothetical protein